MKIVYWYLSFVDTKRPPGERWLGGCFVIAPDGDGISACRTAHAWGCNPGGEVQMHPVEIEGRPPISHPAWSLLGRLITSKDELEVVSELWRARELALRRMSQPSRSQNAGNGGGGVTAIATSTMMPTPTLSLVVAPKPDDAE